jgi:hypothetical protein
MKVVNDKANDWDKHLPSVIFGYRINKQGSSGFSPFELMYGVKPRLPLDLEGDLPCVTDQSEDGRAQRIIDLGEQLVQLRHQAKENIAVAQTAQKKRYDIKHAAPDFAVGEEVLKYNRRRDTRMGDKLVSRYTGPFVIHEVIGRGVYRVTDGETILKQVVNARNLKKFIPSGSAISTYSSPTKSPPQHSTPAPWLPSHNLTADDRNVIADPDGWLNDKIVDCVNNLVRRHLGSDSDQSTLLAQMPSGFSPEETESIQVLHDQNHWVATACVGHKVLCADSLGGRCISPYVAKQLKQLYGRLVNAESNELPVTLVHCPRQTNGSECGVYASAVAFEWAMGYTQLPVAWADGMRMHLIECLEQSAVRRFPASTKAATRGRKPRALTISI